MSVTRRAILKIIGAAPAALPMAASAAPSLLAVAEPLATAGAFLGGTGQAQSMVPGERSGLSRGLVKQLNSLREQFDVEDSWAYNLRTDGIDHDLAVLKSVSRAYKIVRMTQRHRERWTLISRVRGVLWG